MSDALSSIPSGKIRLTYDDYAVLPDDGKRYEIIEGELHMTPAPTTRHQRISIRIERVLLDCLVDNGQGEVLDAPIDVLLDPENVVQPDIVFIRRENADMIGEKNIQGSPDLIIEILSPSTRRKDVLVKSALYARFRVPFYWIVDPDLDRIERFALDDQGGYRLLGTASSPEVLEPSEFPGLRLPLEEIFA